MSRVASVVLHSNCRNCRAFADLNKILHFPRRIRTLHDPQVPFGDQPIDNVLHETPERFYYHSTFDPADIEIYAKAMALPGRTRAAWNGIAPSPPITRLPSRTRSCP